MFFAVGLDRPLRSLPCKNFAAQLFSHTKQWLIASRHARLTMTWVLSTDNAGSKVSLLPLTNFARQRHLVVPVLFTKPSGHCFAGVWKGLACQNCRGQAARVSKLPFSPWPVVVAKTWAPDPDDKHADCHTHTLFRSLAQAMLWVAIPT